MWSEQTWGRLTRGVRPMVAERTSRRAALADIAQPSQDVRATILVVEDDPAAARMLTDLLEGFGYRAAVAEDGSATRRVVDEIRPGLIILDLILPDVDGLVLCSDLKSRYDMPIIVLSATNRKRDAVLALRLGADDFVAKPFDVYDLEARIEAVLRRATHQRTRQPVSEPERYQVGELVVDRARRHVTLGGKEIQLTPTEYRIVGTLASRPDQVLSREELAARVWGYHDASSGRVIDVHICRLRVKLESGAAPPPAIVSVRGFGYKMSAEGRGVASAAS
ncbi:MAG: response regulator [Chloroflexi bacterium]|nr:response regulator [Chloroflexota bacterium]